ncbi:hypothetical protein PMPD1_2502 [Paramixta manurensis]|uniref:Uncharacterized protein n=1 Tax=Paramixta manurensis TaxID=2740817 RepID=A0A6M8UCW4_9GAMM|nr:hypothetical protein PMPD1_2502 [Erwiniaceae bacterium PD-1]
MNYQQEKRINHIIAKFSDNDQELIRNRIEELEVEIPDHLITAIFKPSRFNDLRHDALQAALDETDIQDLVGDFIRTVLTKAAELEYAMDIADGQDEVDVDAA